MTSVPATSLRTGLGCDLQRGICAYPLEVWLTIVRGAVIDGGEGLTEGGGVRRRMGILGACRGMAFGFLTADRRVCPPAGAERRATTDGGGGLWAVTPRDQKSARFHASVMEDV